MQGQLMLFQSHSANDAKRLSTRIDCSWRRLRVLAKSHLKNIFVKLGVDKRAQTVARPKLGTRNRTQAAALARKAGVV
jgi:hypothetical protein